MKNPFFLDLEQSGLNDTIALEKALQHLQFDSNGLIPAIAQQYDTGEVLMMAWMNRESIQETLKTKRVCYWSRSRQNFWRKGESSGNTQHLINMRIDCDGDALLCLVDQKGPACHTNRRNCFYFQVEDDQLSTISVPMTD